MLARRGRFAGALQDINTCLEREPNSGPTLYAAACVAARIAEATLPTNPLGATDACDKAIAFLDRAFKQNYGPGRVDDDPDLAILRQESEVSGVHGATEIRTPRSQAEPGNALRRRLCLPRESAAKRLWGRFSTGHCGAGLQPAMFSGRLKTGPTFRVPRLRLGNHCGAGSACREN